MLLNDPQFVEAARVLAERLLKRFPSDDATRHREAFRSLIGRRPDDVESGILARMFSEQRNLYAAHSGEALKLLGVGESARDAALPAADVAATAMVVSAIMNFDEFLVIR